MCAPAFHWLNCASFTVVAGINIAAIIILVKKGGYSSKVAVLTVECLNNRIHHHRFSFVQYSRSQFEKNDRF
jgi:hypothetical protein